MTDVERLESLKELILSSPYSGETRMLAVVLALSLLGVVLWLVRTRRLREEYTPIWLGAALVYLFFSLRFDLLRALTRAVGAWTASSTLFFFGEVFLGVVCLTYAVRLSRMSIQVKNLAQEVALLKCRLADAKSADC